MKSLLIIGDDLEFSSDVRRLLAGQFTIECTPAAKDGLDLAVHQAFDAVLLNIDPGAESEGLDVLRALRRGDPDLPVIIVSRIDDPTMLVKAGRHGATDFLLKGTSSASLSFRLHKALDVRNLTIRDELHAWQSAFEDAWLGSSDRGQEVDRLISTYAPTDSPVLIAGPTGAGKDVVARILHARSRRKRGPFVAVNCAAIPDELAESTFFGHEKGSFTGATWRRRGCFELASTGTLFLDEVVEMRADLQVKLLRVLESGEIQRVGSEQRQQVNPRIIAASNHVIPDALASGALREDVYYRLAALTIFVPPLSARRADILPMAEHFVSRRARKDGRRPPPISREAVAVLMTYDWPGNLRELRNVMERAVLFCNGDSILPVHLTGLREGFQFVQRPYREARETAVGRFERDYLTAMLTMTRGSVTQTAERIGMSRQGVHKILLKHAIDPSRFR